MKIKMFLGIIALMTAANALPVSAEKYYDTIDYIECGETAVVTGFEGRSDTVSIPGTINGKTVSEIRENAFYKCDKLKKIIIPETVKKIGHHAFYECTALETAEINGKVSEMGEGCFYGCTSLAEIQLPDNLKFIDKYCFYGCENLESIRLPEELEEIGEYAFAECVSLYDVILPEKLMNIGNFVFYDCGELKNINIPDSVINMGNYSVGYCGITPELINDFSVSGDDNSLGKTYAETNNLRFQNINEQRTGREISVIPAAIVIASAAGLMFFRFLDKIKTFRRKYEYEY